MPEKKPHDQGSRQLNLRFSTETIELMTLLAAIEGATLNKWAEEAVIERIEERLKSESAQAAIDAIRAFRSERGITNLEYAPVRRGRERRYEDC